MNQVILILGFTRGGPGCVACIPFGPPFSLLIVAAIHLFWSLRASVEEQELSNRVSAGEGLGDPDWLCSHPLPSTSTLPIKILSLQNFLSYPCIGTLTIMYSIPPVSWSPDPFWFGYLDRCSPFSIPSWVPLPRSSCLCFHWYAHSLLVQKRKKKGRKKLSFFCPLHHSHLFAFSLPQISSLLISPPVLTYPTRTFHFVSDLLWNPSAWIV